MYLSQANRFFALARTGMFNNKDMKEIIQYEAQKLLLVLEKARCRNLPGFGNDELLLSAEEEMQRCIDALKSNDFSPYTHEIAAILHARKLDFEEGSAQYGLFCRNLLKAKIQACRVEIQRCEGDYDNPFDQLITPNIFQPVHPELPKSVQVVEAEEKEPGKTLSEAIDSFMTAKSAKSPSTLKNYNSMNKLLLKILKDKPINQYDYDDLLAVRSILEQVPKKATSMKSMANASIDEIITMENPGELFSETNVMKYLTHMNTIFKFFAKRDWVKDSIRPEWEMSRDGKKNQKKLPFDSTDLQEFFTSNHYKSPRVRYTSPENYWCELISLLSGARVDEVCQLYKEDIVKINGILCFDINDNGDKKLKTPNCQRKIPVHPWLIELGLLDYIKYVKGNRLFMKLKRHKDYGYSHDYDKNINKYIKRHVKNYEKKSFHSFRRSFASFLKQKGVHNEESGALLGHKPANEITEGYAGEYPVNIWLETIKKLDFGFDLVKTVGKWDPVVARRVARKK